MHAPPLPPLGPTGSTNHLVVRAVHARHKVGGGVDEFLDYLCQWLSRESGRRCFKSPVCQKLLGHLDQAKGVPILARGDFDLPPDVVQRAKQGALSPWHSRETAGIAAGTCPSAARDIPVVSRMTGRQKSRPTRRVESSTTTGSRVARSMWPAGRLLLAMSVITGIHSDALPTDPPKDGLLLTAVVAPCCRAALEHSISNQARASSRAPRKQLHAKSQRQRRTNTRDTSQPTFCRPELKFIVPPFSTIVFHENPTHLLRSSALQHRHLHPLSGSTVRCNRPGVWLCGGCLALLGTPARLYA